MHSILADSDSIEAVFDKFSAVEAMQVSINLDQAMLHLKAPSPALLQQMAAEGLSAADFDMLNGTPTRGRSTLAECAPSVLRVHLQAMFLDVEKLKAAFSTLSMSESLAVKQTLETARRRLKVPSAALLARMKQEGLAMNQFGIKDPAAEAAEIAKKAEMARTLLNSALELDRPAASEAHDKNHRTAHARTLLNDLARHAQAEVDPVAQVRARLSGALNAAPSVHTDVH
ncbi:MAG: hypothetical protein II007_00720 [Gammaproteobacteria bacterium]|nr:hypothetical protein [Gammaproteobacteria bacterium]